MYLSLSAYLSLPVFLSLPVSVCLFGCLQSLTAFSFSAFLLLYLSSSDCWCLSLSPSAPYRPLFILPPLCVYPCLSVFLSPSSLNLPMNFFFLLLPTDTFPSPASLQGLCCIFQVSAAHYFSFSGAGSSGFHQTKDLSLGSF